MARRKFQPTASACTPNLPHAASTAGHVTLPPQVDIPGARRSGFSDGMGSNSAVGRSHREKNARPMVARSGGRELPPRRPGGLGDRRGIARCRSGQRIVPPTAAADHESDHRGLAPEIGPGQARPRVRVRRHRLPAAEPRSLPTLAAAPAGQRPTSLGPSAGVGSALLTSRGPPWWRQRGQLGPAIPAQRGRAHSQVMAGGAFTQLWR